MNALQEYAKNVLKTAGQSPVACEIFAKVLTRNDDSGRHGVLIPTDAYTFFPHFEIPDPKINATLEFTAFSVQKGKLQTVAYKYYERYPERRITRLSRVLNALESSPRILVCLRAKLPDGSATYHFDAGNSATGGRFDQLFRLIFGDELQAIEGRFIIRPVDSEVFVPDAPLKELLEKFDAVKERGWIRSLRTGDTGIGYTFETLIGIVENNDQQADFKGIEIKCKGLKEGAAAGTGKLNLFQSAPIWLQPITSNERITSKERIRILGKKRDDGLFACFSQVTTSPNNLGLLLDVLRLYEKIDLVKNQDALGYWPFAQLSSRLAEKHSRAAFVKARVRNSKTSTEYSYEELVYCNTPSIERFVDMVAERIIVFEFTMSEKPDGSIRNHGYPWRLIRSDFLDQLFAVQIKLR